MEIINLCEHDSLVSRYMLELRDKNIQTDRLRFRTNVKRIGQIMAYEISKRLNYTDCKTCLLYTSPSPRDKRQSRMPSSA